ncbi:MAG: hypothetical protein PUF80_03525 [Firmicutes bacterium]|nr:hypothetical protein [Bacillota bacterium]
MWQEMYLIMFRAATQALAQMQAQNFGLAAEELKKAQCCAEELFLKEKE